LFQLRRSIEKSQVYHRHPDCHNQFYCNQSVIYQKIIHVANITKLKPHQQAKQIPKKFILFWNFLKTYIMIAATPV